MVCDLCEEYSMSVRGCMFGKKRKEICPRCMSQFKVYNTEKLRVVLKDRNELELGRD